MKDHPQQSSSSAGGAGSSSSAAVGRAVSPMDIDDLDDFDMYESDGFEVIVPEDLPPLNPSRDVPDAQPPEYTPFSTTPGLSPSMPTPTSTSVPSPELVLRLSETTSHLQHPLVPASLPSPLSGGLVRSKPYAQVVGSGSKNSSSSGVYTPKLCVICKIKNAYYDGTRSFPTCGNKCAAMLEAAKARGSSESSSGSTGGIMRGEMSNPQGASSSSGSISLGLPSIVTSLWSSASGPGESRTTRQNQNPIKMCEVCHVRPKHQRGGKIYPTCGLTCAAKFSAPATEMCDFCQKRPKVVINGKMYPQCGKTCRDSAKAAMSAAINSATCTSCIICWKATKMGDMSDFCSDICEVAAESRAPYLIELPRGHVAFKKVAEHYTEAWKVTPNCTPRRIKRIYMIKMKKSSLQNYEQYRSNIHSRPGFRSTIKRQGNEQRGFLGLTRECGFGGTGNMEPCFSNACLLCCIVRHTNLAPEKFQTGIMTTGLVARATDMATGAKKRCSNVILIGKIVLGKVAELDIVPPHPGPANADSVHIVGHTRTGSTIDWQEYVVYDVHALQPQYLISFE
ncbi:hypothetical protein JR316_0010934 [Psilocybe cubensis]|uniref:Uncharacterized protein n=2 Tax=Psilocybe cubensis TaxID=181762 RepID=A0A8H7XMA3_PSICU|nr:hypothetical protein JR316_0010934 [Psilocybe cubensis]KAH9477018.1 hypothetical protein JR316_0010934 [Psilocybe cubensis]